MSFTSLKSSKRLFQRVLLFNMYNLLFVEATNDMSFPPPETKYDEPFRVIGTYPLVKQ